MTFRCNPSRVFALLVCLVAISGVAQADQHETRSYLPAGSVDGLKLIGPPPAIDSETFDKEMAIVLWLQETRTPEQVAFVEKPLNVERFAHILGDQLFGIDGLELKRVIDAAISDVRRDYDAIKAEYDLPRPFQVNDEIKPVGDARPVASYPSGHATRAMVYARLLSVVFPDREKALIAFAKQVGYGRVIAGVHYPTDITAGQTLGDAYAAVIVEQPAFKDAVARVTAE